MRKWTLFSKFLKDLIVQYILTVGLIQITVLILYTSHVKRCFSKLWGSVSVFNSRHKYGPDEW
jgi:hypothetical protein